MSAPAAIAFGAPGLFGKIPAQPDFVRLHAGERAVQALAEWLEDGLAAPRPPPDAAPVRFLLRFAGAPEALLGAVAPSGDRVGRSFPLAVFAPVPAAALGGVFPRVPAAAGAFLDAVEAILSDARGLALPELQARVRSLAPPAPDALASAADVGGAARPARELLAACDPAYALHVLRTACDAARGREEAKGTALDVPLAAPADAAAWLELVRALAGGRLPPCVLWREGPPPRLLVALGTAPAAALAHVAAGPVSSPRIWPLVTTQPDAALAARRALGPALLAALDRPGLTAGDLASSLAVRS